MNAPQVSIVVPLFNEKETFPLLVQRMESVAASFQPRLEVVLVDDGSRDGTDDMIRQVCLVNPLFHGVFLSRNYGHQVALSAGIRKAKASEALLLIDGDLQDPPELLADFYNKFKEGNDVVYAIRTKRKEGAMKRFLYFFFYRLLRNLSNTRMPLDSGDFSLISRRVADVLNQMPEESRFLRGLRSWVGFRQVGIPYERDGRAAGHTKYRLKDLLVLAYNGIFNFSTLPVRFITRIGLFSVLISLLYIALTIYRKWMYDDVPTGFTALLMTVTLFGGVQLLSLGIIGEYVLRIFFQVKGRPLYLVREEIVDGKAL